MGRGPSIAGIVILIWLIIGAVAAGQRGYYGSADTCAKAGTVIVTVIAGPLNYLGVNPQITCNWPTPSSS